MKVLTHVPIVRRWRWGYRLGMWKMGNGTVIRMSNRRGMKGFAACAQVEAYWESLRRSGDVPPRADVDPRGIEDALNYAFILESIGPGLARIRIAGMHLSETMGMEVRGMPVSSFIAPASREAFARALGAVTKSPAKMSIDLQGESGWGQPPLEARMLLLPLRSDLGDVSRILGCFETLGTLGKTPRRFTLAKAHKTLLDIPAPTLPDHRTAYETPPPEGPVAAETQKPLKGAESKHPPYLRLVKTDS